MRGASSVSGEGDRTRPESRSAPARQPFVLEAQRALRDLGFDPGPIDGICGPKTRAALEKYQITEKLPATGELDGLTLERLDVYRRLFRPTREL
jgi:peptidoglycan hydrolase-like protein with peptidoglycan-binding domain